MVGAMAFDFLDGFAARALKATSPIGKELDSLSDLVSFGVLPGLMVYVMLKMLLQMAWATDIYIGNLSASQIDAIMHPWWLTAFPFIGLFIPLFSAFRLAKFNVDTRQSYGFLGLPTPANALFFLSIFLVFGLDGGTVTYVSRDYLPSRLGYYGEISAIGQLMNPMLKWLHDPFVLAALTLIFSILLITEIPLLAMKFKDYTWKGNWPRYVLILISVTLLAILWFRAIPLIIVLYFLFSFIDTRLHKKA